MFINYSVQLLLFATFISFIIIKNITQYRNTLDASLYNLLQVHCNLKSRVIISELSGT